MATDTDASAAKAFRATAGHPAGMNTTAKRSDVSTAAKSSHAAAAAAVAATTAAVAAATTARLGRGCKQA
jgi:hypothetical protein